MIIDDEEPDEERLVKKRKGFSYYPLLTYKRDIKQNLLLQVFQTLFS